MKQYLKNISADLSASVVVFLVALPLCLGIALGSGAPVFAGIIAGVVGGVLVGFLSGSPLSVSGPAAGLTAIVAGAIGKLPSYDVFLVAVVLAGILQIVFGKLKAGVLGNYIPNAVIKGMLAAIGLILILKQLPHLVGFDNDFEGDESFVQPDHENTLTELFSAVQFLSPTATLLGLLSLTILLFWQSKWMKKNKSLSGIPAPLIAVLVTVGVHEYIRFAFPAYALESKHLVGLPVAKSFADFKGFFMFPNWSALGNPLVWTTAITLAVVASLETLLGIEAVDKLDPLKRITPTNRELYA
ncbi:MAG: SulP family inorganic anion transporter, partial [Sphingobacteriia bacterium]